MIQQKKILVLFGHTDTETNCGSLATAYEHGARSAGHSVKRVNIGNLQFDPILHHGYKTIQALEPDLLKLQDDFRWAEHIVIFYPNWWGTMPAILKGLFDRFYLPGFAFRFDENGLGWDKLLKGRTGRVVITMDSNPWLARILFGDNSNEIKSAILGFAGVDTSITKIGSIKKMSEKQKENCKEDMARLGARAR